MSPDQKVTSPALGIAIVAFLLVIGCLVLSILAYVKAAEKTHIDATLRETQKPNQESPSLTPTSNQPAKINPNLNKDVFITSIFPETIYDHNISDSILISLDKPRIAICYSGLLRNFFQTKKNHTEFFKRLLPEDVHIDFYLHTWYNEKSPQIPQEENFQGTEMDYLKSLKTWDICIDRHLNFKSNITQYSDEKSFTLIPNLCSMFKSIQLVNQRKVNQERVVGKKYDLVIKMRTDLFFYQFPTKPLDLFLNVKPFTIYTYMQNQLSEFMNYAVNDQFAIGSSEAMDEFAATFHRILASLKQGCAANPECLLGFNLRERWINVQPITEYHWRFYRDIPEYQSTFSQEALSTL
jgi:hypothetical protein